MIRSFLLSDLNRILEIEGEAFPKSPYSPSVFLHLHRLYPETFLVYIDGSKKAEKAEICGYVVFSKDGHLISLAVHPCYRRKGIGGSLIKKALQILFGKRLRAEVRVSNKGALAFYRKLGFEIVGTLFNYYGDEDALLVQRITSKIGRDPQP